MLMSKAKQSKSGNQQAPNAAESKTELKASDLPKGLIADTASDKYHKPPNNSAIEWQFASLHTKYPGFFQCWAPTGKESKCYRWLAYTTVGSVQNHFKTGLHNAWYDELCEAADKPESGQSMFHGKGSVAKFNRLLALWIPANFRPFEIVNDIYFVDMLRALVGNTFKLPSRKSMAQQVHQFGRKAKREVSR